MATKKAAAEAAEEILEEKAEETKAEETKAQEDPWAEEVEIYVPRKAKGDDQSWPIFVNDRRFYVPANGKRQKMPRPIAEILEKAVEAENAVEDYIDQINRKTAESAARINA